MHTSVQMHEPCEFVHVVMDDLGTVVARERPVKKAKKRSLDASAAPGTGYVGAAAGACASGAWPLWRAQCCSTGGQRLSVSGAAFQRGVRGRTSACVRARAYVRVHDPCVPSCVCRPVSAPNDFKGPHPRTGNVPGADHGGQSPAHVGCGNGDTGERTADRSAAAKAVVKGKDASAGAAGAAKAMSAIDQTRQV